MKKPQTPESHWREIRSFWNRVNKVLRETREQPVMIDDTLQDEWMEDVHSERIIFTFVLPPFLQALRWEIYHVETAERALGKQNIHDDPRIWRMHVRRYILKMLFKRYLDLELKKVLGPDAAIKKRKMRGYLCDGWTMKYIEYQK